MTSARPGRFGEHMILRLLSYVIGTAMVVVVAFALGVDHSYDACPAGGECDLAGAEGMLWAMGAFALCVLVALGYEIWHWGRRRSSAPAAPAER